MEKTENIREISIDEYIRLFIVKQHRKIVHLKKWEEQKNLYINYRTASF